MVTLPNTPLALHIFFDKSGRFDIAGDREVVDLQTNDLERAVVL